MDVPPINEQLAEIIIQIDPSADWIFNKYCGFCGKFLYSEDLSAKLCKKCKSKTVDCVKHPIPVLTSGTAFEKVVQWIRDKTFANRDESEKLEVYQSILKSIENITHRWMHTTMDPLEYHEMVLESIIEQLLTHKESLICHT